MHTGIKYEDLAYGSSEGFATVGSNNGHNGTTAITMLNNLDVTIDFAWRSYVNCNLILICNRY
jgi:feruloyl esterase